jgi:hypothetical protein
VKNIHKLIEYMSKNKLIMGLLEKLIGELLELLHPLKIRDLVGRVGLLLLLLLINLIKSSLKDKVRILILVSSNLLIAQIFHLIRTRDAMVVME